MKVSKLYKVYLSDGEKSWLHRKVKQIEKDFPNVEMLENLEVLSVFFGDNNTVTVNKEQYHALYGFVQNDIHHSLTDSGLPPPEDRQRVEMFNSLASP